MADERPITDLDPILRKHLERVCRAHGLDLDHLPDGLEPQDLLDQAPLPPEMQALIDARRAAEAPPPAAGASVEPSTSLPAWADEHDRIASGEMRRPVGRPRKSHPPVDWAQIEHLLVFGEPYEFQGQTLIRYPTPGELARRFNVEKREIQRRAKEKDLAARRAHVQRRVEEEVTETVVAQNAAAIARGREKVIAICDLAIDQFHEALKAGKIRIDSATDIDKIVRLREFAAGNADRRSEHQHSFTLQDLQERHREHRRRIEASIPAEVVGREARELPAMGVVEERLVEQPGGGWLIMPLEDETAEALGTDEPARGATARTQAAAPAREDDEDDDGDLLRLTDDEDGDEDEERPLAIDEGEIETHAVVSSNIAEMGYDAERRVMEVYFHTGAVYRYAGVSQELFDAVFHAGSPGRAFAEKVKPHYHGVRIDGGR